MLALFAGKVATPRTAPATLRPAAAGVNEFLQVAPAHLASDPRKDRIRRQVDV